MTCTGFRAAGLLLAALLFAPAASAETMQLRPTISVVTGKPAAAVAIDGRNLLRAGTLADMALGRTDAPVTIVTYTSLTCGHCARFHTETLPPVIETYVIKGKVRLIVRDFPLDPRAEAGAVLARCAGRQRYFEVIYRLYRDQNRWAHVGDARRAMTKMAGELGFPPAAFEACLQNRKLLAALRSDRMRAMEEFGVTQTPTFFVNGRKYTGAQSAEALSGLIETALGAVR